MKKPNLQSNYYFLFYTQQRIGRKKRYYTVNTVMHLSEEVGILISLQYWKKKVEKLAIRRTDDVSWLCEVKLTNPCIT